MRLVRELTVTAAEACRGYGDLHLALLWRPEGTLFEAEVLGTMEDCCVLGGECDWRHNMMRAGRSVCWGVAERVEKTYGWNLYRLRWSLVRSAF